jgi:hypothetical protein
LNPNYSTTLVILSWSPGGWLTSRQVKTLDPVKIKRVSRILMLFCFNNDIVTGDGAGVVWDEWGEIHKTYRFRDGTYLLGD